MTITVSQAEGFVSKILIDMQEESPTMNTTQVDDAPGSPRVSVIMSAYNAEAYLEEALDSILNQTYSDFELVVIDDGSKDRSKPILERYANADSRIKLISRENRGLTVSLNEGLGLARGELIARMDADDICEPHRVALQVSFLDENLDISAVGGAIKMIDAQGQVGKTLYFPTDHDSIEDLLWQGHGYVICHPALMVRREAIQHVGGYDAQYQTAQDLDLYLRLGEVGRLGNLDDVILRYRRHPGAVGVAKFEQQDHDVWRMLNAALSRRGIKRPKGFYQARWEVRRNMAIYYGAKGSYFVAFRHALYAFWYRPFATRSYASLLIALLGPYAARKWSQRSQASDSMKG